MKKKALSALLALLMLLSLCACSAKNASPESYDYAASSMESTAFDNFGLYDWEGEDAAPSEQPEAGAPAGEAAREFERKIVRNADISLEAEDARQCYAQLLAHARSLGGYESSCSVDAYDGEYTTSVYLSAVIKLPPDQLDGFMAKAGETGTVTNSSVTSDEITADYYDAQTRLNSLTAALDSYYALLDKAETIDEVLSIQSRIDQLVTEIEVLKGTLRLYDSMVDESTVSIYISEYNTVPAEEKEFQWDSLDAASVGKLIKNGFLGVCNFLWSLLQWLAIILISASPLLLIAGAIVFFIVRGRKARKQKQQSLAASTATAAPTAVAEGQPAAGSVEGYTPPAEDPQR